MNEVALQEPAIESDDKFETGLNELKLTDALLSFK